MGSSRIAMVMETIRRRIEARALAKGAKLPSIRALAKNLAVSASTVVEAYERLLAEGLIVSRRGSGFYVAGRAMPLSLAEVGPRLDRDVDPFWISRQSLESANGGPMPGCGWLPPALLAQDGLRRALRKQARASDASLADYGHPLGLAPLRQLIAGRLAERGIEAPPGQIMLTESGTQAIDFLCRLLIEPGDSVLVDDPCYFNFQALLRAHRAKVIGVPYTPTGVDAEPFAKAIAEHRPRLYITNAAIHNPTGATLSPVVAHRVLKQADQAGLTIIEDDIFADFEHTTAPRLAAFDGLNRVISIGSFSKTLSAAARCGYIAAPPQWIERLVDLKIAVSFGGGRLAAELVFEALRTGSYRKHVESLRSHLARCMAETASRLRSIGILPWLEPEAGMFLWCRLPAGRDAASLARAALAEGIVLAPGNAFSPSQSAADYMRFNVSQMTEPRIYDVLARFLKRVGGDRLQAAD